MDNQTDLSQVLIPGLSPEHSANTIAFLRMVVDAYGTSALSLIMRQRILSRNTYLRQRNPDDGKLYYVLKDGERIITGRKGVDWSKPAIYDLVEYNNLFYRHYYYYPKLKERMCKTWNPKKNDYERDPETGKILKHKETLWVCDPRPPLLDAIIAADTTVKYLFVPVLVYPRNLTAIRTTSKGAEYCAPKNYSTNDAAMARCVWVDIDGHDLPIEDIKRLNSQAIDQLMSLLPGYCQETGVPMPAVVNSGRGIHMYWWFDAAVNIYENIQQFKAKNGKMQHPAGPQQRFKMLLNKMNTWAKSLIEQSELCRTVWQTDNSTSAIYHMMNLPGCVHPKTGERRYVVNQYGTDYFKCSYDHLCDVMGVLDDNPVIDVISLVNDFDESEQLSLFDMPADLHDSASESIPQPIIAQAPPNQPPCSRLSNIDQNPIYNSRLNKLLHWAAGRVWDLQSHRHLFLFCVGVVFQCGSSSVLTDRSIYPLHDINKRMVNPLGQDEVNRILDTLVKRAAAKNIYKISDARIADKLDMTAEERTRFCSASAASPDTQIPNLNFQAKLREFIETVPWDMEHESTSDHRQRGYDLTVEWFNANRIDRNRNSARMRRRKAKAGYAPKGGRPRKYTETDRIKCLELRKTGMSIRSIVGTLGFPFSAVQRLLTTDF